MLASMSATLGVGSGESGRALAVVGSGVVELVAARFQLPGLTRRFTKIVGI